MKNGLRVIATSLIILLVYSKSIQLPSMIRSLLTDKNLGPKSTTKSYNNSTETYLKEIEENRINMRRDKNPDNPDDPTSNQDDSESQV